MSLIVLGSNLLKRQRVDYIGYDRVSLIHLLLAKHGFKDFEWILRKCDGLVDYLGLPRLEILPWPLQPDSMQQESAYDQVLLSKMTVTH